MNRLRGNESGEPAVGSTPREEARRARNDVYRQHLLAAAEKIFSNQGFESAKVQEIAAVAGLSMGTIYALFPSKVDLFRALLEERGEDLLRLARDVASARTNPRAALDALIEAYIDYFVAHPDFLRMHLRLGTSWGLGPAPGSETQLRHWQDIHEIQADVFRRGIAAGEFIDEDPGYLAKMFSAMDQVLLADWAAGGMQAGRDELVRRLKEQVARSFHRPAVKTGASAA
jgi:AcrR family transcriptional regulator